MKAVTVLHDQRRKRLFGNLRHVACSLANATDFATIANRAAHLLRDLDDDFVIDRLKRIDGFHNDRATLGNRTFGPFLLHLASLSQHRAHIIEIVRLAGRECSAINWRYAGKFAHVGFPCCQPRSKPRATSQSVTRVSKIS